MSPDCNAHVEREECGYTMSTDMYIRVHVHGDSLIEPHYNKRDEAPMTDDGELQV